MAHLERKIKLLATKLTSLQSELQVSREIMTAAGREVDEMFVEKYFPEIPVKPEKISEETNIDDFSEEEQKEKSERKQKKSSQDKGKPIPSAEKVADPEVKRLFKKIATITHPDKLSGLSEYESKKKQDLFRKAMIALENNDLVSLADIAADLEIEAPDLSKEKLKEAEQKIITIKKELNHIESTYVWRWFFCEEEEEKDKILTTLFGIMYANGHWS